jgi:2-amino-4-hydroxy-6-hydroxymethyldihydropteridine diphosphokinase
MATVYLGIGSNVGDSRAHVGEAIKLLSASLADILSAPLYISKAFGYTDQPDFLNTVVCGTTDLPPLELLHFVKQVEVQVGRIKRFRWGPREIDIDIIFYDDLTMQSDELTIPHASFAKRDFVLRPITDLNPDLVDPLSKKSVANLLASLPANEQAILRRA